MDYCNSLLAGVADVHLRRLQSVQNAAARLVSGARPYDHITWSHIRLVTPSQPQQRQCQEPVAAVLYLRTIAAQTLAHQCSRRRDIRPPILNNRSR